MNCGAWWHYNGEKRLVDVTVLGSTTNTASVIQLTVGKLSEMRKEFVLAMTFRKCNDVSGHSITHYSQLIYHFQRNRQAIDSLPTKNNSKSKLVSFRKLLRYIIMSCSSSSIPKHTSSATVHSNSTHLYVFVNVRFTLEYMSAHIALVSLPFVDASVCYLMNGGTLRYAHKIKNKNRFYQTFYYWKR